ncbi:MAG: rhomboid family intramembrane serine protease [Candidatus Bathyarchaeia archaeon]|jgi:rhomboid protease GluP
MNSEKYRPTIILIALNAAMYIYTSIVGGNALNTNLAGIPPLYQYNIQVLQGSYYQLFTSMFIHASIPHLVGNMLFLFIFGLRAEEMFSLPEYLGIYLVGGLAGNVLSLAFGPEFLSVGASGAIFALFGACVIYDRRSVRQSIVGALVYAFFLLLISGLSTGVNDLAHLGGLGFGLIIGYWIATTRKPQQEYSVKYKNPLYPF